jgi:Sec-independent protein translocase protein TatA
MNILGIGPLELLGILVVALLVLGPDKLEETGRTVGKLINKVTRSEGWAAITSISRELRGLPARLAREAQLDDLKKQIDIDQKIGPKPADIPGYKPVPESSKPEAPPKTTAEPNEDASNPPIDPDNEISE